jgi:hypothetical protein
MMKIVFCLGLFFFPLHVQAFPSDPLTTVDLKSPVRFLAADGSDVEIPSGTYGVESAEEWIRLVPEERRNAFLIEADRRTHPLNIDSPVAMSFPGEKKSEADFHFVMLLLPGGESLEAAGTYSGIRPRGFNVGQAFNKAKNTATNAYTQAKSTANKTGSAAANAAQQAAQQAQQAAQQAQQQAQQAAAAAQKGLQGAQSAALQAKQAVEQGARQAGQAIGSGVQTQLNNIQNNPLVAKLESEIQTLEAVRKLNLEPLFACFRQSSGQSAVNFPQMIQQFTANPPDFANQLFQDIMRQWEQSFSEVMAEQLQFIRTPSRSAPQGPQVIGMAFRSIEKLAQKAPGGKCLMQFVRPHLQAIQSRSGQVQQTTMTQGKRIFDNQVAPILFGSLSKQIGELMSAALSLTPQEIAQANVRSRGINPLQKFSTDRFFSEGQIVSRGFTQDDTKALLGEVVPGLGDIISIKNAVLADQLLNSRDLYAAAAQIELLTQSLNNPTQRGQALNGVRTALDPDSPWTESLYIDIGMEILRVVGKNYLDSELPGGGSFLIRSAVEVLDFGEQTVGTVVQSVAGLVPEAGGIVSGIAKVTPDVIWKLAINNIIVGSVKGGAHFAYGKVIDEAKNALKTGQPYAAIQRHAGPLSALLRYLPSKQQIIILASTHTEDTRKALERYNQSVLQLAEAATR